MCISKLDVNGVVRFNVPAVKSILVSIGCSVERAELLVSVEKAADCERVLVALCDRAQLGVEKSLMGEKATVGQISRYKDKYERAVVGEYSPELNSVIIEKYEAVAVGMRKAVDMIEKYREYVSDVIALRDFERAGVLIAAAPDFCDISVDEIDAIFVSA